VWLLSLGFVNRIFRASVQALSSGDLRDRIFELAKKAGVPVKQIYVLPDSTSQLSNAFASSSNVVMITASLLKYLSKREVDSILAHELGHLKEKHPQVRGYITLAVIFVMNIVASAVSAVINLPRSGSVIFSLALLTSTLIMYFVSRSNERHADAIAIGLTGDPESFISGFAKLCRLNLMPLNSGTWGQSLESHPRSLKRLQDIARFHSISEQRFQELLNAPLVAEGGYSILNAAEASMKAFSSDFKRKRFSRVVLAMLAMLLLSPVAVSLSLAQVPLHGWPKLAAYVAGAIVTFLLYLVAKNFVSPRGYGRPVQSLRPRLEQQGFGDAACDGVFVGLAPAAQTQKYENGLFWDAGVLWLTADKLYYIGEETCFGLERKQIANIYCHNSRAEWMADMSLVVEWRGKVGGDANNAIYFVRLGGRSVLQERRDLESLYRRINDWLERSQGYPEASPQLQSLPSPSFKAITSEPVSDKFNPLLLFKSGLMLSGGSALLSFAFGLSLASACYSMAVLFFVMLLDELPKILAPTPATNSVNVNSNPENVNGYSHAAWAKSNPAPTVQSVE
jgi:Zn-dependent protease with chaperone function